MDEHTHRFIIRIRSINNNRKQKDPQKKEKKKKKKITSPNIQVALPQHPCSEVQELIPSENDPHLQKRINYSKFTLLCLIYS